MSLGRNVVSMVGGGSVGGNVSMGGCEYGWSMSMGGGGGSEGVGMCGGVTMGECMNEGEMYGWRYGCG